METVRGVARHSTPGQHTIKPSWIGYVDKKSELTPTTVRAVAVLSPMGIGDNNSSDSSDMDKIEIRK